jgi:hypothetical protein
MASFLALLLFVSLSTVVPVPIDTPIPCLICREVAKAGAVTFSGTVALNTPTTLRVFNPKTLESMVFTVPPDFRGVESGDGVIKDATLARATPGLAAQVTYVSVHGRNTATRVLLLTVGPCRSLAASERLTDAKTECPD